VNAANQSLSTIASGGICFWRKNLKKEEKNEQSVHTCNPTSLFYSAVVPSNLLVHFTIARLEC
jgi:hypothetical protein